MSAVFTQPKLTEEEKGEMMHCVAQNLNTIGHLSRTLYSLVENDSLKVWALADAIQIVALFSANMTRVVQRGEDPADYYDFVIMNAAVTAARGEMADELKAVIQNEINVPRRKQ